MPMDAEMAWGMALICIGMGLAFVGLRASDVRLWLVLIVTVAVDVMKPATLGFVMPGMAAERGIRRATVAAPPAGSAARRPADGPAHGRAITIWLYHAWSSVKSLVLLMACTVDTLLVFVLLAGLGGVIAMLVPYAAEV